MISSDSNPDSLPEDNDPETAAPEIAGASGDIADFKAELDKVRDQLLRALADAENTRKRAVREREDATKYAVTNFARDMIGVADNLRRALEAVPEDQLVNPHVKALMEGIEATERDLESNFQRHHLRKIDPLGELFNPNYHEVIFEASMPAKAAGEIIQVAQVGYLLQERLIRPARVGVVKDEGQGRHQHGQPGGNIDTKA